MTWCRKKTDRWCLNERIIARKQINKHPKKLHFFQKDDWCDLSMTYHIQGCVMGNPNWVCQAELLFLFSTPTTSKPMKKTSRKKSRGFVGGWNSTHLCGDYFIHHYHSEKIPQHQPRVISYQVRLLLFAPYFDGLLCVASRLFSGLVTGSAHHQQLVKLLDVCQNSQIRSKPYIVMYHDLAWKKCPKNPSISSVMAGRHGISKAFSFWSFRQATIFGMDPCCWNHTHTIPETCIFTHMSHEWLIRMVNVGHYASPMDAVGYSNTSWVVDVLGESPHHLVSFETYTFGDFFVDFCRGSFALCRHFVVPEVEKSTSWLYGFMYIFMQISEQHLLDIHWVPHLSATYHTCACLVHPGTFFQPIGLFLVGIYIPPPKKGCIQAFRRQAYHPNEMYLEGNLIPRIWKPSTH